MIRHRIHVHDKTDFLQSFLDAVPVPVLVVDPDLQLHRANAVASREISFENNHTHSRGVGDALECLHSTETPEGCGASEHCQGCILRQCLLAGIEGQQVYRREAKMQLHCGGDVREVHLLITTTPMEYDGKRLVLLTLEDVSELVQLRSFLPICTSCRKLRDDETYLEAIELYLHTRLDVDFSHALCPDCRKEIREKPSGVK